MATQKDFVVHYQNPSGDTAEFTVTKIKPDADNRTVGNSLKQLFNTCTNNTVVSIDAVETNPVELD